MDEEASQRDRRINEPCMRGSGNCSDACTGTNPLMLVAVDMAKKNSVIANS